MKANISLGYHAVLLRRIPAARPWGSRSIGVHTPFDQTTLHWLHDSPLAHWPHRACSLPTYVQI